MTESQSQPQGPGSPRHALRALLLPPLLTTLGLAALLMLLHVTGILALLYDREALTRWIEARGALAPLAFLVVLALRPFTLFPSVWLAPFTAEFFGILPGAGLKVAGETIGATLAFLFARYGFSRALGRYVRRVFPRLGRSMDHGFAQRLGEVVERRGLLAVLALRMNLLLPFDGVNYGLGLTTVRLPSYVAGTLVGIIPGTLAYVALSGIALRGDWRMLLLIIAGILVMILLSVPLARDLLRR